MNRVYELPKCLKSACEKLDDGEEREGRRVIAVVLLLVLWIRMVTFDVGPDRLNILLDSFEVVNVALLQVFVSQP